MGTLGCSGRSLPHVSWRFARTPKWIVRHVVVAVLLVAMLTAMSWQLRRLDDKRDHKALVEARQEEPAVGVGALIDPEQAPDDPAVEDVLYRSVTASGTYLDDATVVVENRTYNSTSGGWVLTPLELEPGVAVVVNRGFIGFDRAGEIVAPPAPTGRVSVAGLLFPTQVRGSFGATDPDGVVLERLARVDLERYDEQVADALLPAYIQVVTSDPGEPTPVDGAPQLVALGPPELSEGPHLAYAAQWLIFSVIAAGGYGLLLRKLAREQAQEQARDRVASVGG